MLQYIFVGPAKYAAKYFSNGSLFMNELTLDVYKQAKLQADWIMSRMNLSGRVIWLKIYLHLIDLTQLLPNLNSVGPLTPPQSKCCIAQWSRPLGKAVTHRFRVLNPG